MPESLRLFHPEAETADPLRQSKETLRGASEALRAVFRQFGADWTRLAAAFPEEGFMEDGLVLTACRPPARGTPEGVVLTLASERSPTTVYSVEERCTRCGDTIESDSVHVFQTEVAVEKCIGLAIDSIDEKGDAVAVLPEELLAYRRQERARREQEAAAGYGIASLVRTISTRMRQLLDAIPRPNLGRLSGRNTLHQQRIEVPAAVAAPAELRIDPISLSKTALEQMLQRHASALQAAAAILEKNAGTLQTRIAELKAQEAAS